MGSSSRWKELVEMMGLTLHLTAQGNAQTGWGCYSSQDLLDNENRDEIKARPRPALGCGCMFPLPSC